MPWLRSQGKHIRRPFHRLRVLPSYGHFRRPHLLPLCDNHYRLHDLHPILDLFRLPFRALFQEAPSRFYPA